MRIPEKIQQKQYEHSPMKDFLDAQMADFGGSAKVVNEKLTAATTKDAALNNIKTLQAAESTNIGDYDKQLARNLSLAANLDKEYTNVEDALKDPKVTEMLTEAGVAHDFVDRWHKTNSYGK